MTDSGVICITFLDNEGCKVAFLLIMLKDFSNRHAIGIGNENEHFGEQLWQETRSTVDTVI